MRRSKPVKSLRSTTIRLETEVLEQFREAAQKDHRSMNDLVTEWITKWTVEGKTDPFGEMRQQLTPKSEKQLAEILADSVAELLQRDRTWAQQIIRTAQLQWPGGLLQERMGHYPHEKILLAKKFAEWLGRHMEHLLEKTDVYLLIDAGSTNLWFSRFLWAHLARLSKEKRPDRKIVIVTNNVPVAQAFAEQYHQDHFKEGTKIIGELLGGQMEPWYGALVGTMTKANLVDCTAKKTRPGKYISLSAGNYVRLSQHRPAYPIPLIRGEGQKAVKETYIDRGDEIYVVAPLGKIFLAATPEINRHLHLDPHASEHKRHPYEDVAVHGQKQAAIKLVTTLRSSKDSILFQHSGSVRVLLNATPDLEPSPESDITEISHFCYTFDDHVNGKNAAEQRDIEFPHGHDLEFRKTFYSVDV